MSRFGLPSAPEVDLPLRAGRQLCCGLLEARSLLSQSLFNVFVCLVRLRRLIMRCTFPFEEGGSALSRSHHRCLPECRAVMASKLTRVVVGFYILR